MNGSYFRNSVKDLPGEQLAVFRKKPVKTGPHEITVELLVKKDNLNKFAKIEEYISPGFRAVEGDSKGGIFSFSQGTAKILWMNLPPEQEFIVSYKIIPESNKNPGRLEHFRFLFVYKR